MLAQERRTLVKALHTVTNSETVALNLESHLLPTFTQPIMLLHINFDADNSGGAVQHTLA